MLDYLSNHWRQIPHVANNGPAGHYSQQIAHDVVFAAVPEGISKLRIILQRITKNKWLSLSPDHHSLSDLGLCGRTSSRCHPFAWTAEELSLLWAGCFFSLQLQEGLVGISLPSSFLEEEAEPDQGLPARLHRPKDSTLISATYTPGAIHSMHTIAWAIVLSIPAVLRQLPAPLTKSHPKLWNSAANYFHLLWLQRDRLSLLFQSSPSWTSSRMYCLCRCLSRR